MSIEFKSSGYRIDATEDNLFLGVIFSENWSVYFRPCATELQKAQILAKMKELQSEVK